MDSLDESPIGDADLKSLFEYLDRLDRPPCSHTLKETIEFLKEHGLPIDPTVTWLGVNGGYCDCEVIYNATTKWGDKVGWEPNIRQDEGRNMTAKDKREFVRDLADIPVQFIIRGHLYGPGSWIRIEPLTT